MSSSDLEAYGRKQQGIQRSLLHRYQRERIMQIHMDNRRLRELAREKEERRELVERTWVQQLPSHSAICKRGKEAVSQRKEDEIPSILRAIDARAAYYEHQLLSKLQFLRAKPTSGSPLQSLTVSSQASYLDSYSHRKQMREKLHSSSVDNIRGIGKEARIELRDKIRKKELFPIRI